MNPPDFIQVPYPLLIDKNLQPLDLKIYGFIYWFSCLKNETCNARNKTFASLASCSESGVENSLVRLVKYNHIRREFTSKTRVLYPQHTFRPTQISTETYSNKYQKVTQMSNRIRKYKKENNNSKNNKKNVDNLIVKLEDWGNRIGKSFNGESLIKKYSYEKVSEGLAKANTAYDGRQAVDFFWKVLMNK